MQRSFGVGEGERDLQLPPGRSGSPRERGLDASTDQGLTERSR